MANGHLQDMCLVYSNRCIWRYDVDEYGVDSLFKRNSEKIYFKTSVPAGTIHAIPRFV